MVTPLTSGSTGWAQLRQQIRSLESQTESLFQTYSQYASTSQIPAAPSEEEQRLQDQVEQLLSRRENVIAQLNRLLDSEATLTASAMKQNNLSRHREVLADHRREFARLQALVRTNRDRANLLVNVRRDIDAYLASNPAEAEADYMLAERSRIDQSHGIVDGVLSQAYAINEQFGVQREIIANVNRRIVGAASQIPGVNALIGKIGAKKRRDAIILGSFIAFCCLVFLWLL